MTSINSANRQLLDFSAARFDRSISWLPSPKLWSGSTGIAKCACKSVSTNLLVICDLGDAK